MLSRTLRLAYPGLTVWCVKSMVSFKMECHLPAQILGTFVPTDRCTWKFVATLERDGHSRLLLCEEVDPTPKLIKALLAHCHYMMKNQ